VASSRDPLMSPAWSPDGEKLAYVGFDIDRGRTSLRLHDLTSGEIEEISSRPGINGAPAWSPDGDALAMTLSYTGNPEIHSYDLETGQLTRLTHNGSIDTEPTWSSDGDYIAFTSDRGGKPQVYRMRRDGGQVERLSFVGESSQRPVYSPDGEHLAMIQGGPNGFRIAVLNLKSNNVRVISDGPLDESPSFAPNGQTVIYARQSGNAELATVSIDGKVHSRLRQQGQVREPAWSPAGY
jgi:TolB protein